MPRSKNIGRSKPEKPEGKPSRAAWTMGVGHRRAHLTSAWDLEQLPERLAALSVEDPAGSGAEAAGGALSGCP